jgi:glycosyltransferase involved in cell wall biosynthesis
VIAVDDRSVDATGAILQGAARNNPRMKFLRVDSLPPGWLGKPHALQRAYREIATGEWLVFTDADVHFQPDLLRRALALAAKQFGASHAARSRQDVHLSAKRSR